MDFTRDFVLSPLAFTGEHSLNMFNIIPVRKTPSECFTITSNNSKTDEVTVCVSETPTYLGAYYLPFNGKSNPPASILIPKYTPEYPFVLTGALSGCSIVVVDKGDSWEVFHDPRVNVLSLNPSPYKNKHVVAAFQYRDYMSTTEFGSGAAFLWFDNILKTWYLIGQKQEMISQDKYIEVKKRNPITVLPLI